ncbi:NADPH-dependent FMN reductase [Nonomuraea angiospora]|uniref:FMN reductase n=2 Tax=Nonomuraea TaxID=83681 RepID=A0A7W9GG23_9ACTN|nr:MULTISPECIES: NADPH-dependent FMN reductase [Nonomuraea]MBB5783184.1 FMN reductase [Nonomuraea jabiensis]MBE1592272.1 FMN reductase [Nonomuraea angiospora]
MTPVLLISGSPSATSRTGRLLDHVAELLDGAVSLLHLRDLPAEPLLLGRDHPDIVAAERSVAEADVIVLATPIYKAAYTGLVKAFLDGLPQKAFAGKTVVPIATGGTQAHLLAVDYALRPVLSVLGARHVTRGLFVLDTQITPLAEELRPRLRELADEVNAVPLRAVA